MTAHLYAEEFMVIELKPDEEKNRWLATDLKLPDSIEEIGIEIFKAVSLSDLKISEFKT